MECKSALGEYLQSTKLMKEGASAKMLEPAEAHLVLALDPKYADHQLRSTVILLKW